MAEKKPSYQKKKPDRKPRVTGGRNTSMFAKDVRVYLRRAKFKQKRGNNSEEVKSEEHLPPPQPQIRLLSCDETEKDEESEEEFLSYVKATVSDDRNYNFKDKKNCSLGCCKSCGLLSHDLTLLDQKVKTNTHDDYKRSETQLNKKELTNIRSPQETTEIDDENVFGDSDISKPGEGSKKFDDSSDLKDTKDFKTSSKTSDSEIESLEDDLNLLLKLKEPIVSKTTLFSQVTSTSKVKEPTCISTTVPTKSVDFEKWVDSVLDF